MRERGRERERERKKEKEREREREITRYRDSLIILIFKVIHSEEWKEKIKIRDRKSNCKI